MQPHDEESYFLIRSLLPLSDFQTCCLVTRPFRFFKALGVLYILKMPHQELSRHKHNTNSLKEPYNSLLLKRSRASQLCTDVDGSYLEMLA